MIRVDAAKHLHIVATIIQNKYLAVVTFFYVLGGFPVPFIGGALNLLFTFFIYVLPFYLAFVLFINNKAKWALSLLILMITIFILGVVNFTNSYVRIFVRYLPVLSIVIFCFILNSKMKEWGYQFDENDPIR